MTGETLRDGILVGANTVLVCITAYYAWQSHRMVQEMKLARSAQVLPRLVPTINMPGPAFVSMRVVNVGVGSAIDVDCQFQLEPGGPAWHWTWPILPSGAHQDFTPEGLHPDGTPFHPQLDQVLKHYRFLRLTGTYKDALGTVHQSELRAELAQTIEALGDAGVHWNRDPVEDALHKGDRLVREVEGLRRALERIGEQSRPRG